MNIRTAQLEGRDHFVVPVVMITVGVHNGSQGPIFYPADELKRSVPYWDGRPVVVYHPEMYSNGFAAHPEVFNRQKVGTIFNTRFVDQRLKADAWIDVERVGVVDPRVLNSIRGRKVMEVSTGLVFDNQCEAGVFNSKTYQATARAIQPDHLAVLPDQIGACSVKDGAGLLRNEAAVQALELPVWELV
ncbi:MAG: DUF2213 domain-containing protein [Nibricoccus sp.]